MHAFPWKHGHFATRRIEDHRVSGETCRLLIVFVLRTRDPIGESGCPCGAIVAHGTFSMVSPPMVTPMPKPLPAPASASDTFPLVITWASPLLGTPMLASAAA